MCWAALLPAVVLCQQIDTIRIQRGKEEAAQEEKQWGQTTFIIFAHLGTSSDPCSTGPPAIGGIGAGIHYVLFSENARFTVFAGFSVGAHWLIEAGAGYRIGEIILMKLGLAQMETSTCEYVWDHWHPVSAEREERTNIGISIGSIRTRLLVQFDAYYSFEEYEYSNLIYPGQNKRMHPLVAAVRIGWNC